MRKLLLLSFLLVLCGCGGTSSLWHVYGASGKLYQAPELCQAVAECVKSGEKACYQPTSTEPDFGYACTEIKGQ